MATENPQSKLAGFNGGFFSPNLMTGGFVFEVLNR